MVERLVVVAALAALVPAGAPVAAQSEKPGSGCERDCKGCPDSDDCVSRCKRCWGHCTAKGVSVGYHFHCRQACWSRSKQCWR